MILETLEIDSAEFVQRTGWELKPQGACKDDRCVPLGTDTEQPIDVRALARRLGMPLLHDETSGLWCLGPEAGGAALTSAEAPALELPGFDGTPFRLSALRGRKVLLVAWASW